LASQEEGLGRPLHPREPDYSHLSETERFGVESNDP